jgi:hypothetical protein
MLQTEDEEVSKSRRSSVQDVLINQPYTAAIEKAAGCPVEESVQSAI